MPSLERPRLKPGCPNFSSGPCAKRPGWSTDVLAGAILGRSHRAKSGKDSLRQAIDRTHALLGLPAGHRLAIMPASDTGAFEAAMWCLLGARGIDVLAWESFGKGWADDILKELRLGDVRKLDADYGALPDLASVDFARDVVFTWNGTTSGVRVPNADWIPPDRTGLTLADATSAAFAQPIDWTRIDVATFSWQKVLGGEAQHGMLALSPRAIHRLETYRPDRAIPKIFRLTKGGKLIDGIFQGETINTPSMLCLADYLDALDWAERIGGLPALRERADGNAALVYAWVDQSVWLAPLARDPATRSNTSVCLRFTEPRVTALPRERQMAFAKRIAGLLETDGVAYDIASYRDAPPGLRIWTGATVERADVAALLPWLDWAHAAASTEL